MVSDNLANMSKLNNNNIQVVSSYDFSVNNQVLSITQVSTSSDPYIYFNNFITLNSGTYTMFYLVDELEVQTCALTDNNSSNIAYNIPYQNGTILTINSLTTFGFGFEGNGSIGRTFNIRVMIYEGTSTLSYEPFGTYVSKSEYDNLQNRYDDLAEALQPFKFNAWNKNATLNGTNVDISSSAYMNNIVGFYNYYLELFPRDMELYSSYINGVNSFELVATTDVPVTLLNYTAIANFSSSLDYYFSIDFYNYDNMVYSSSDFNNDMTSSDGSSSTNTYYSTTPITFNKFVLYMVSGPDSELFNESSYFKTNPATFTDGYNYAVSELQPKIDELNNEVDNLKSQNNVRYSEGYTNGFNDANSKPLYTMILAVVDAPVDIFRNIFNFDILGINIVGVVFGILTLLIIIWLIKKLL